MDVYVFILGRNNVYVEVEHERDAFRYVLVMSLIVLFQSLSCDAGMPWSGSYNRWINIGPFLSFWFGVVEFRVVMLDSSRTLCQEFKFDSS